MTRGIEELYPKVSRVVRSWQTKRESPVLSDVASQALFINRVYVKWWICQDEVELSSALMQVFVVGIGFADVSLQSVDGKIHPAKFPRFACLLLTVDGNFRGSGTST